MRNNLIALRKACGYSQYSFAEACGISRSHYSQIETGEKNPSLRCAIKIKKCLNYQNDDIFFDNQRHNMGHSERSNDAEGNN